MNRRSFCKLSALATLAPVVGLPITLQPPRDKFEVMSAEEIARHWHYAPLPVFRLHDRSWVVRTYRSKCIVSADATRPAKEGCSPMRVRIYPWDIEHESGWRKPIVSHVAAEINRLAAFYRHAFGTPVSVYVHNVRLCESPLYVPGEVFYPVFYRVAFVRSFS